VLTTSIRYDNGTLHPFIHPSIIHHPFRPPPPTPLSIFGENPPRPPFPSPYQDHPHLSPLSPQPRNLSIKNTSRIQQTPPSRKEITTPTTHVIQIHTTSCPTPLIIKAHNRRSAVKRPSRLLPCHAIQAQERQPASLLVQKRKSPGAAESGAGWLCRAYWDVDVLSRDCGGEKSSRIGSIPRRD